VSPAAISASAPTRQVYPCFRHLGLKEYHLGVVRSGINDSKRHAFLARETADVDNRPVSNTCWARYLCGGYADSVVYGPDRRKPQQDHCPFWRTEIETAILFYDRLRQEDPAYCFRLFGDDIDDIIGDEGMPARFLQPKNCQ
jgi:radical SAM protein with 4Fe4S-binding SPASM domain